MKNYFRLKYNQYILFKNVTKVKEWHNSPGIPDLLKGEIAIFFEESGHFGMVRVDDPTDEQLKRYKNWNN